MNKLIIAAVSVCAAFLLFVSVADDIASIANMADNIKYDGEKL